MVIEMSDGVLSWAGGTPVESGVVTIGACCFIQVKRRSIARRSAYGCVNHKVGRGNSKKSADCRGTLDAHIAYVYEINQWNMGLSVGEKETPPGNSGAICGVLNTAQYERRSRLLRNSSKVVLSSPKSSRGTQPLH